MERNAKKSTPSCCLLIKSSMLNYVPCRRYGDSNLSELISALSAGGWRIMQGNSDEPECILTEGQGSGAVQRRSPTQLPVEPVGPASQSGWRGDPRRGCSRSSARQASSFICSLPAAPCWVRGTSAARSVARCSLKGPMSGS